MTIRHIDTGEYIQAQHEKIERLQAELQWHRTNLANGYGGQTATDAEIAQAIIRAYPSRFGGIAAEMLAHLADLRTGVRKIKDVLIIVGE
jgi:hypothetical protein